MKPWQRGKKWYESQKPEVPFESLLGEYMTEGLVYSSQTEFLLARECLWEDGTLYKGDVKANCWFVHLAASTGGNPFERFLKIAPRRLHWVAWQRRGVESMHVYKWEAFKRRVKNGKH